MAGAKGKKKQSRLAFAPIDDAHSLSARGPDYNTSQSSFSPARLRYSNPFSGKVTVKGQLQLEDYTRRWNNTELDDALTGPEQRSIPEPIPSQSHNERSINEDSTMGSRHKERTLRRRSERLKAASSPMSASPRSTSLKIDLSGIGEPEESASGKLTSSPTYRKRRARPRNSKALAVNDDSEDSDLIITGKKHKRVKPDDSESEPEAATNPGMDDNEGSSDDDDIVAFTPSWRASKRSRTLNLNDDDDDDQGSPKTPSKLRSEQDELDLEEDLEDLRDTDLREKRTRGAVVNSARSVRQKHLEMLRRRRAGEKAVTDAAEGEGEEDEEEEYDEEKESHNNAVNAILNWARNYGDHSNDNRDSDADSVIEANEDLDTDDSSFIEEDGELGAPVAVPFEFSRHRTKHTKDCFRDVIEWMVHSKLNPAFPRGDEMYQFAFRKVGDELVGRIKSQLASTVWNADFLNALRARPYLDVTAHLPSSDSCNACNRSGHWASSDLKLSGKPYSDETLEPLYDSDSDSDEDSETQTARDHRRRDIDSEGHILPSEDTHFYLGRTCKSNAVLTHTLVHWRFHLYEWVVDYLNRKEELLSNPQRSLEREKLSAKKRTKYANKVVDKMNSNGEVQRLWTDFHQNLRTVREMQKDDAQAVYN
ncbi:hypothetical protein UA08_08941 [Talaromyces atroroseus]|uniref:DUF4211 domain-containing protein n=1 Tax=Talaromyces atroroseus TaxID=1441469 RepID=A0A225AK38_TALAT|nr:hypothetical protein UA08_08941 [Talaromyces atroroseus]OKL55889.1 hypothetical protein UA08_08941 [Talaromyces atroroseus]